MALRLDNLADALNDPITDVAEVLTVLLGAAAKKQHDPDLWARFHEAVARDGLGSDAAFAYEGLLQDTRMKLVPAQQQADVFVEAARFFRDLFDDPSGAVVYLERAIAAVPDHPEAFARLEQVLIDEQDAARMAALYVGAAARQRDAEDRLRLLRNGIALIQGFPRSEDELISLHEQVLKLDGADEPSRAATIELYSAAGRHRDAARAIEQALSAGIPSDAANTLRERAIHLYANDLKEPQRAAPFIEELLAADPNNPVARDAATALLKNRTVAARVAAALSGAYDAAGEVDSAADMLKIELELVRGPRRRDVQRRLAFIGREHRGQAEEPFSLLEPVIQGDPADDEARRLYVDIARELERLADAAKLLSRVASSCRDEPAKARMSADLGEIFLELGDTRRAQAAFESLLESANDDTATLAAARRLAELYGDDPAKRSDILAVQLRLDPEPSKRHAAARELVELCRTEITDAPKAIAAWRALLDSDQVSEALEKLQGLYEATNDRSRLVEVLDARADRAQTPAQTHSFAFRAAELRAAVADEDRALELWTTFLQKYGPSREAHAKAAPLLLRAGRFEDLAHVLERELDLATPEERPPIWVRLGQLRGSKLGDVGAALRAFDEALTLSPTDANARAALEKLMGAGPVTLAAATILERVFRAEGDDEGLLRVLEARATASERVEDRLTALDEAGRVAAGPLRDPKRALQAAARGLTEALDRARSEVPAWVEAVIAHSAAAGATDRRAAVLAGALGDRSIDSPEVLQLATATGDALADIGRVAEAVSVFRRALGHDPTSPELLQRVDDLLAEQGRPEERLALYQATLRETKDPERARRLLIRVARLFEGELEDEERGVQAWRQAVAHAPSDLEAHQGLAAALEKKGDLAELYGEHARILDSTEGEQRLSTLARMAELASTLGRTEAAVGHWMAVVPAMDLGDSQLDAVESLGERASNAELVRLVLVARVRKAVDPTYQAMWLERLGELQAEKLRDTAGAVDSWKTAARLCETVEGDDARSRTRRLYERVLGAARADTEAAERLLESYSRDKEWTRLVAPFSALLEAGREASALEHLLAREEAMREAGAIDDLAELATRAVNAGGDGAPRALAVKARALASEPSRHDAAARTYREAIERYGEDDPSFVDAFRRMLEGAELNDQRKDDRRWLFSWRVEHAADAANLLLEWAAEEEHTFDDRQAALAIYSRVTDRDPKNLQALENVARLRALLGDPEGALDALEQVRGDVDGDARIRVDLAVASLMLDALERPDKALGVIEPLFEAMPTDANVLRVVRSALTHPTARERAAAMLDKACDAAPTPDAAVEILEGLLDSSRGSSELGSQRVAWYHRLIELRRSDPIVALNLAVGGAREHPADEALWTAAFDLARRVEQPEPVAVTLRALLEDDLDANLAEALGLRAVDFHQEWFEDDEAVVGLLERVLELAPQAHWALDRLKLAFNAQARWNDLFRVYDRALGHARDDEARLALLEEAALAAKDFASDGARAIDYLEQQRELRPGDSRVEASLERLYEREGRTAPLIDLLSGQLGALEGRKLQAQRGRIAGLWLDVGDEEKAFELTQAIWTDEPAKPEAVRLLEAIVERPVPIESMPPAGKGRRRKKVVRARDRAAALLAEHYEREGRKADVVRMMEVGLEAAVGEDELVSDLERIVTTRVEELGDHERAFGDAARLVQLRPEDPKYRNLLADLAEKTGKHRARADHLVVVARGREGNVGASLVFEAAEILEKITGDPARAIELYLDVLEMAEDDEERARRAARALDPLLAAAERHETRCAVLEKLAELDREPAVRRVVLAEVARVAAHELADAERAERAWRARLSDDDADREALDGLVGVLDSASRWADLADVLEWRASKSDDAADARADRVRRAQILGDVLADPTRAIAGWRTIREIHGADSESFAALLSLLEVVEQWEALATLVADEAAAAREEERSALLTLLGDVHRDRTGDLEAALESYAGAQAWERAAELARSVDGRERALAITERLFTLASERWTETRDIADSEIGKATAWCVDRLGRRHLADERHARVVDLFLVAAKLPFAREKTRELRREAACLAADRLGETERAMAIFRELIAEDPADEIAGASAPRLAPMLTALELHEEVVALWETQARCRGARGANAAAIKLWLRAAELAETKLDDGARAIASHREAAALGSDDALEALARLHSARGERRPEADALEFLFATAQGAAMTERALRLADAYVALDRQDLARARLEHAVREGMETATARRRLAELYDEAELWAELSELLTLEADLATTAADRVSHLLAAANLRRERLEDPRRAAELLARAVEADPDAESHRFALAESLTEAGDFEAAAAALREQIDRYGPRKPKARAVVHFRLARVLAKAGDDTGALGELETAARIDQAHPDILRSLARRALDAGDLDRAEQTYRALLLVLRRPPDDSPDSPSRAEAFIDLGEIAAKRSDEVRATEFVESAFEAALEDEMEAARLERALRKRGRRDLLSRAIELRLEHASTAEAARALSDLVVLHAEGLAGGDGTKERVRSKAAEIRHDLGRTTDVDESAWLALGRVYDWLGDAEAEAAVLERCVERALSRRKIEDPEPLYRYAELKLASVEHRPLALRALERALEVKHDLDRAEALLLRVARNEPTDPRAARLLEALSRTPGREGPLLEALVLLALAPAADPDTVRECVYLAHARDERDRALLVLRQAVGRDEVPAASPEGTAAVDDDWQSADRDGATSAINPGAATEYSAWLRMSLADLVAEDEPKEACELREAAAALVVEERAREVLLQVARDWDERLGDLRRAASVYEDLVRRDATDRDALDPLLALYRRLDDGEALAALITRTLPAFDTMEGRTRLRLELATVLLQDEKRTDEAARVLRAVLTEDPSHLGATGLLSGILEREGKVDELTTLLETQLDAAKDRQDVDSIAAFSNRLAKLLERQERTAEALDVHRGTLEWAPKNLEALRAVVRLGESADAFERCEALERLLEVESGDDAEPHARQLIALREDQVDDDALERALALALRACPTSTEFREKLLGKLTAQGEYAKAATVLEAALAASPQNRELLVLLVDTYRSSGNLEPALDLVGRAMSEAPADTSLMQLRAQVLEGMGFEDDALGELRRAFQADPALATDYQGALVRAIERSDSDDRRERTLELVDVLERCGQPHLARGYLEQLLEQTPGSRRILRRLAALLAAAGETSEAVGFYQRVVVDAEGPLLAEAAVEYADLCERAGHSAAAVEPLERALNADPGDLVLRDRLRRLYEAAGEHRGLAHLLAGDATIEENDERRFDLLLRAGRTFVEQGGYPEEGIEPLEQARAIRPEHEEATALLARAYGAAGRAAEGLALLEAIIEAHGNRRSPELSVVLREAAGLHAAVGNTQEAVTLLARAFDMNPKSGATAMDLATLATQIGDSETADRAYRSITMMKVSEVGEGDGVSVRAKATAYYELGRRAHESGEVRKAKMFVTKALHEDPEHEPAKLLRDTLRSA